MTFSVYICAPFDDGAFVRVVHERLEALGISPSSTWVTEADGAEDFTRFAPVELRRIAERNDRDIRGSHIVLVLDEAGRGRETCAEARIALEWGKPVVWVGRPTLSTWRRNVVRAETIDEAIETLVAMRDHHLNGYRGELLVAAAKVEVSS